MNESYLCPIRAKVFHTFNNRLFVGFTMNSISHWTLSLSLIETSNCSGTKWWSEKEWNNVDDSEFSITFWHAYIHLVAFTLTQHEYCCNLIVIRPYVSDSIKCQSILRGTWLRCIFYIIIIIIDIIYCIFRNQFECFNSHWCQFVKTLFASIYRTNNNQMTCLCLCILCQFVWQIEIFCCFSNGTAIAFSVGKLAIIERKIKLGRKKNNTKSNKEE